MHRKEAANVPEFYILLGLSGNRQRLSTCRLWIRIEDRIDFFNYFARYLQKIPFVLKKEIYASASLAGALAFYPAWNAPRIPESAAMLLGAGVTVFVRLVSVKYKLGLPAVRGE